MSSASAAELSDLTRVRSSSAALREFLLVGGATPLFFLLAFWLQRRLGLEEAEFAFGFTTFWAAHIINDPHFAVTYLLFYQDFRARAFGAAFAPAQRLRYLLAGLGLPLLLAAWVLGALSSRSAFSLGLLIQLMFLLVGWHYVKQGFGVLVVLSARRGVHFAPRERLAILAHCYAGWAYAWASPADPGRSAEEKGVVYMTLAHPPGLERLTQVVFLASVPPLLWVLIQKWKREHRLPLVTPLTGFLCSVWSWSVYSSFDPLVRYVIPALHSVQYLYMVWLLKGNEAREREGAPWFEKPVAVRVGGLAASALILGWLLFRGAPAALDGSLVSAETATSALGATPCFAALYAFVNIHHYVMDNVIWRKDNPLTRYLRTPDTVHAAEIEDGVPA